MLAMNTVLRLQCRTEGLMKRTLLMILVIFNTCQEINTKDNIKVHGEDGLFSVPPNSSVHEVFTQSSDVSDNTLYATWSAWTPCITRTCTQKRVRKCKNASSCSEALLTAERTCWKRRGRCSEKRKHHKSKLKKPSTKNIEAVVYDLLYYDWSEWSTCTRSCKKRRYRTCALKRWCKHTVLLEEQECFNPGTACERRYMLANKDKHENSADTNKNTNQETNEHVNKLPRPDKTSKKKSHKRKPRPTPAPESEPTEPIQWDPSTCGQRSVTGSFRIVGGTESRRGSWPWQVAILTKWKEQYCGGVLIAPNWVLTAAHCVRKRGRRRKVIVRTAEYDLSRREGYELDHRALTDFVHHDFDIDTIDSDIALLKLKTPVAPSKYVNFACVPDSQDTLPTNTLCYAVGWGKMRDTHIFGADVLREAQVPLVEKSNCENAFDYEITPNQMCAGYKRGGVDTCAGDSGGPLMCQITKNGQSRWHVYGVTSFGEGCGDKGKYGIYTRVTNFSNWIKTIVNKN